MCKHIGGFGKLGLVASSYASLHHRKFLLRFWASLFSFLDRNIDNIFCIARLGCLSGSSLSIDVAKTRAARSRFLPSLTSVRCSWYTFISCRLVAWRSFLVSFLESLLGARAAGSRRNPAVGDAFVLVSLLGPKSRARVVV